MCLPIRIHTRAKIMRLIIAILVTLSWTAPLLAQGDRVLEPARPNIMMILIDDMGWSDLSCFGGKVVQTPNIDRLASEGLRFRSFYVNSPICSPSRTALTTGNYPGRHGITSFLSNRRENKQRGLPQWLDPSVPTLAKMLKARGYATGHFGKWHMGGQRDVGEAPLITEYGFDQSLTNFEGLGPRVLPLNDAYDGQPAKRYSLGSENLDRGTITWVDRNQVTRSFVDGALAFIEKASSDGRPWMINLWPDDVHSPFFPPRDKRGDGKKRTLYYNVLANMDEQLGPLLDRIRNDAKLRDNTIILFASDNGPEPGAGLSNPLRGSKGELWEGGIRSPLIVWAPGLMPRERQGTINQASVLSSVDLTRSIIALSQAQLADGYQPDGEELQATLLGKSETGRQQPLMWRRPPDRPSQPNNPRPDLAIRSGPWKLVCDFDGQHAKLYNLVDDESETRDVTQEHTEIAKQLTTALLSWSERP